MTLSTPGRVRLRSERVVAGQSAITLHEGLVSQWQRGMMSCAKKRIFLA